MMSADVPATQLQAATEGFREAVAHQVPDVFARHGELLAPPAANRGFLVHWQAQGARWSFARADLSEDPRA